MDMKKSEFQKKVEKHIRDYGGEDAPALIHALLFHLNVLLYSRPEEKLESRQEVSEAILSKLFVDTLDRYPKKPFVCKVDEYSDWNLRPLPSEFFFDEKPSDEDRTKYFVACLKVGDILDCRVSSTLLNSYQLRVIHKYGVTRIVDDLNIMVEMVLVKSEHEKLGSPLLVCELVRVVISEVVISEGKKTFHVSLNPDYIPLGSTVPKLGKISESDLPFYVFRQPDVEKYSCYADYLISKPQFKNSDYYHKLFKECGLNPFLWYSYFRQIHGKECAEGQTGQSISKESKLATAKLLANKALENLGKKNYAHALKLIEEGMKICPEDDPHLSKLYFIRSKIYFAQSKSEALLKVEAYKDLEKSVNMVSYDEEAKEAFIKQLFNSANVLYKQKQYKKAASCYEHILELDPKHTEALRVYNRIKTKYADQLLNLEETSLTDLREKKKELRKELSELMKIKS